MWTCVLPTTHATHAPHPTHPGSPCPPGLSHRGDVEGVVADEDGRGRVERGVAARGVRRLRTAGRARTREHAARPPTARPPTPARPLLAPLLVGGSCWAGTAHAQAAVHVRGAVGLALEQVAAVEVPLELAVRAEVEHRVVHLPGLPAPVSAKARLRRAPAGSASDTTRPRNELACPPEHACRLPGAVRVWRQACTGPGAGPTRGVLQAERPKPLCSTYGRAGRQRCQGAGTSAWPWWRPCPCTTRRRPWPPCRPACAST